MGEGLWSRDHKLQKLSLLASIALLPQIPEDSRVLARPEVDSVEVCDLCVRSSPPDHAQQWCFLLRSLDSVESNLLSDVMKRSSELCFKSGAIFLV